jgi:hypothetical protein
VSLSVARRRTVADHPCMGVGVVRVRRFWLVLSAVAVLGSAFLVEHAPAAGSACSLITAAQARALLGYPLRIRKGETAADCVISAFPVRLDPETLAPVHPTITFSVTGDSARARPFAQELADARKRGFGPAPGFGSSSYLVEGPQRGAVGIYARVGASILELDVGPASKPITRAQALSVARRIGRNV